MMSALRTIATLAVAALAVMSVACRRSSGEADRVPRPRAYARITLCDTLYTPIDSLPVHLEVNSDAESRIVRRDDRAVWADVSYPIYRGVLHLTLTRVRDTEERQHVTDNRTERMALNLGDNTASQLSVESPGGFITTVLTAESAAVMPVQFLSVGRDWIVSGAFSFADAPTSADSIRPVVDAVTADVINLARNLK